MREIKKLRVQHQQYMQRTTLQHGLCLHKEGQRCIRIPSFIVLRDRTILPATLAMLNNCKRLHEYCALCDIGPQVNFLSESMFKCPNPRRTPREIQVEGTGATTYTKGMTMLQIRSLTEESFALQFDVYIQQRTTNTTPMFKIYPNGTTSQDSNSLIQHLASLTGSIYLFLLIFGPH